MKPPQRSSIASLRRSKTTRIAWAIVPALTGVIMMCATTAPAQELTNKMAWLPQLSLGVTECYDNNIFGVSGNGMPTQEAWITKISPGIGFDFAPLLGTQAPLQSFLLNYTPDFVFFALPHGKAPYDEPLQDYDSHKFGAIIKGSSGDFSFSLDNSFVYIDGNKTGPTYALNQLSGAGANQFDKYRDYFAASAVRERCNQIVDRDTAALQYDLGSAFIRPSESLLYYDMDTAFHNSTKAPYIGYQNYVDRNDVNGGADLGYKMAANLAVTLGYRYGSQFQQQFTPAITSDYTNYSSSTYQRVLVGLEGKLFKWLDVKLDGGPDFRDYNSHTPVTDLHPTKYYGEASVKATIASNQSLSFNYKQWNWLSPVGFVPEFDSTYALNYHWNATSRLGFDLGSRIQEFDYTGGNDVTGLQPSLRADRLYTISPGASYAFTPHLSVSLSYTYEAANNELNGLPANDQASYRNYIHQVVSLGLLYEF